MLEISIPLMVVFLIFSAFFSSSEAAFLSLQRTRIAHLVTSGVPGSERIAAMIGQPERLLSTILLGNNLVNVAFTALVTVLIVKIDALGEGGGIVVATVVGTTALLIVGEIIPKTIAWRNAERAAFLYARPLKWVETLMLPLVIILQWTSRRVGSALGGVSVSQSITEGEFRSLIDIGEAEGTFEPVEAEMLENVFRFGDRQVREVMTPRTEIVSIERGATLREFLSVYAENSHTRFPVYKETVDDIIGLISAKDILKAMSTRGIDYDGSVTDLTRDAHYVPETKRISELFDELRQSGNQMAIAVDEFGGLAGLVTLKRLSEEVVGPVGEEGMAPEEEYETIDKDTFQVDGGMSIDEVNDELEIDIPSGDFETIAGFALEVLGHIPAEGEQFDYGPLSFEITQMDALKIENIRVTRTPDVGSGDQDETDTGQARRDSTE
jgi:CBS domain containing-hemolysin-like protein